MWTLSTGAKQNRTMKDESGSLRDRLVATAVAILETEKQEGLSLREVAKKCGVSHNAPYHHFTDKSDLMAAVAAVGFRNMAQTIRREGVTVAGLSRAYLHFATTSPEMVRVMFGPCDHFAPNAVEVEEAARDAFALLLEGVGRDCPDLDQVERTRRAIELWSLLHGFASLLEGSALVLIPEVAMPTAESMTALVTGKPR